MMLSRDDDQELAAKLELGSEPWWMQDIRCAQRAIERERAARPTDEDQASPEDEPTERGS